ncbi:MAG: pyridoxamine 5'-phosphate oxidase family protein [Acutalibacteraceae bacterium]|nr:pyridoxamine 5'-phosphate oxidase family protein [Acutalibacteraceae bacterium]
MNGMTRRERQVTDINEILKILDNSKVLHLGLVDGDEPYVVPMNYGYTYENDKLTIWLHCARQGRKLDVMRANPKVFFEMEYGITPFEGEVACKYGITYSSLMGRGVATIIEDVETKKIALSSLMKVQTGKDFTFEDRMAEVVGVVRIDVIEFTAKHRPLPKELR